MAEKPIDILLIEDNPGDVRLLQELITETASTHFRLSHVECLSAGLERLAEGDTDVILLDLSLPDSQGVETLTRLHSQTPDLPIIVLTGMEDEALGVTLVQAGAQDYLIKGQVTGSLLLRSVRYAIERKRAEEALWRNQDLLHKIINTNPNIIFVKDRTAQIILANQALAASYQMPLDQILGSSQIEFHTHAGMNQVELEQWLADDREVIDTGLPKTILEQYTHRDGSIHWTHTQKFPLDLANGERGVLVISEDITKRKLAEEKIIQLNAKLEQRVEERTADLSRANAELAKVARAKDEFLAGMSHELRTPLNAILGLTEVLQEQIRGPLNEHQLKSLRIIEESGRHLLSLINDILDLSKIEAGKLDLQADTVSVEAVCQASLQFVKETAVKKKISISTRLDNIQTTLQADTRRLKQILVNLLTNAVKFTPEGGQVGLEVSGKLEQEVIRFIVWDTGVGIPPEELARLFQPFVQLDSSLSRQHEGTGLGLALVSRLTELHGGSVAVESQVGRGSRFIISLPWRDGSLVLQQEETTELTPTRGVFQQALIIEDSSIAAEQITRYLSELNIEALVHPRAEDAVAKVLERRPDVIVLDILFSGMSGWEALAQLKADPRTRDIPVIVISVVDEPSRGLALGAAEYLVKPISRLQLRQALNRATQQQTEVHTALVVLPKPETPPRSSLIMLAEDNENNIKFVVDYLVGKQYRLIVARNGAEAVNRAKEERPALILMDIQMPVMDGLEAIRCIRVDAHLANIPIIALTALAMPGDRERCLEAGANEYLSKPVSLKSLADMIEMLLQKET